MERSRIESAVKYIEAVAKFTLDGEVINGDGGEPYEYEMSIDDAFDTASAAVECCRSVLPVVRYLREEVLAAGRRIIEEEADADADEGQDRESYTDEQDRESYYVPDADEE